MSATYAAQIDPTDFWSWKKIEAGHYVLTTDTRYTATVRKEVEGWAAEAASPSGRVRDGWYQHLTMADAREWALDQIKHLVQQDETELLARSLDTGRLRRLSSVAMSGPGNQTAWFTVEGEHHTYKVTVERWNG
jgi:hypothetical protein